MIHITMNTAMFGDNFHRKNDTAAWKACCMAKTNGPDQRAQRLKAAWAIRRAEWPGKAQANLTDFAKLLATRDDKRSLKADPRNIESLRDLGNRITRYFTQGVGKNTSLPAMIEETLEVPQDFLRFGTQKVLPPWSYVSSLGNLNTNGDGHLGYVEVSTIFVGGAGVFAMEPDKIEAQLASEEGRVYIEVRDASLLPGVEPGRTIVFKPWEYPRLNKTLLVRSNIDKSQFAIRTYRPESEGVEGAYVDSKPGNRNSDLPESEWSTVGYALGALTDDGVLLNP